MKMALKFTKTCIIKREDALWNPVFFFFSFLFFKKIVVPVVKLKLKNANFKEIDFPLFTILIKVDR